MRRIIVHKPGGHHRLVFEDRPDPEPGPGEVAVDRSQVFAVPKPLTLEQAAAIPCVFLTAYYALFMLCLPAVEDRRGGETMLVHSAAGGVGGALVQLGNVAGPGLQPQLPVRPDRAFGKGHGAALRLARGGRNPAAAGRDLPLGRGGPGSPGARVGTHRRQAGAHGLR